MNEDDLMTYPAYIKKDLSIKNKNIGDWYSIYEKYYGKDGDNNLFDETVNIKKPNTVTVKRLLEKECYKVYKDGYTFIIKKKDYEILQEFEFTENFNKLVAFSQIAYNNDGEILKCKQMSQLAFIISNLYNIIPLGS